MQVRVLIVDDSKTTRRVLSAIVSSLDSVGKLRMESQRSRSSGNSGRIWFCWI